MEPVGYVPKGQKNLRIVRKEVERTVHTFVGFSKVPMNPAIANIGSYMQNMA